AALRHRRLKSEIVRIVFKHILRRLAQAIPTLLGITILSYALMAHAPGGPVAALTFGPDITNAQKAKMAEQLGVNDPWIVQYVPWLGKLLHGDLGRSFAAKRPVIDLILERAPATLELGGLALLFGTVIGVPLGVWAAVRRGSWFDTVTRILAVIVTAVPTFWLGLVLILVFGAWLKWLPMGGRFPTTLSGDYTIGDRI